MEYVLNDVLISLYGKANPYYDPSSDDLAYIAVDFNNDGHAESTVTGWVEASNGERVWSWWCNGVGPFGEPDWEWMKYPCWVRFGEDGSMFRKSGLNWLPLSSDEASAFKRIFHIWVDQDWNSVVDGMPLKAFSHTGRVFIGKSRKFHVFTRCELYDVLNKQVVSSINRSLSYSIDPNGDQDVSDSHIMIDKEFQMKLSTY